MNEITMLELRNNAEEVVRRVRAGQRLVLTYRGKPAMRLEPIDDPVQDDDPFYRLADLAEDGESLTNQRIDEILYGG